jgi:hypothetical protein
MPSGRVTQHLPTRFESKYIPEPNSGCWLWLATNVRNGDASTHGQFWVGTRKNGTMKLAHRVSYELYVGPIPEGMNVNHRCDTASCVNPDHLQIGTQAENVREAVERGVFHWRRKARNRKAA